MFSAQNVQEELWYLALLEAVCANGGEGGGLCLEVDVSRRAHCHLSPSSGAIRSAPRATSRILRARATTRLSFCPKQSRSEMEGEARGLTAH